MKTQTLNSELNFYGNIIKNNIDFNSYNTISSSFFSSRLKKIYNIFSSEFLHNYNLIKFKNNKELIFKEWLQGLPSCLTVPFYNYEILKLAKNYGFDVSNELKEDLFLENYWLNLAKYFFVLLNNDSLSENL